MLTYSMCLIAGQGVVLNMRGVALRCVGNLQRAAESYQAAIDICQEYEDLQNWAVAQANLGETDQMCCTDRQTEVSSGGTLVTLSLLLLVLFMKGCCV